MKTRMLFGTVVLAVMAFCAPAAEKRTYPCHRLAQAPAVDGKPDDACWKNIPEATGFYVFPGSGKYALEKQTYFKAGWTDEALYLAVRAEEIAPEKMIASGKDGGALWSDDSIELFFLPKGAPDYTQFIVNSAGSRCNGRGSGSLLGNNVLKWEARTVVEKTEWFLEARIPFAVLMAQSPKENDEWPANVARNILTGPAGERCASWPLLQTGFHDVKNFGRFVLKGAAGDKVLEEEKEVNGSYISDMKGEIRGLADLAGKYEKELAEARKVETLRAEAEGLLRIWEQEVKADNAQSDILEWRAALRAGVDLQEKSDDCISQGMLEALFRK